MPYDSLPSILSKKISEYPTLTSVTGTEWTVVAYLNENYKIPLTGIASLVTKASMGLANVDNTSDALKPISVAVQAALNMKSAIDHTHTFGIPSIVGLDSALLGKSPVDHTHTGYAEVAHTHTGYSEVGHTHTEYAPVIHAHNNYALLLNPAFTGTPTAPTAPLGSNTTQIATTEFVQAATIAAGAVPDATVLIKGKVQLATGIETITGTDSTKAVTPAGLSTVVMELAPIGHTHTSYADINHTHVGFASSIHTHTEYSTTDHVHAQYAPLASPSLTGVPLAPTATLGTSTTQLATTEFVQNAVGTVTVPDATTTVAGKVELATSAEVAAGTDDTRAVTPLGLKDVTVTLATLASPALTGVPLAPTAAGGTNTTQIATTAFVKTAVDSFITKSVTVVAVTTATRTLALSDAGTVLRFNNASAKTLTVDAATNHVSGMIYHVTNRSSAENLSLAAAGGMVLNPPKDGTLILEPGDTVSLHVFSPTEIDVYGSTLAA